MFGGLTARYVEAGVMAAVVTDESRLLDQIRPLIAPSRRERRRSPHCPTAIQVAINPTVARHLNLSDEAIRRAPFH
ncbi:MAG: hypothetical protein R3F36_14265 [Candidatus Competibacteraceae bacterium]